MSQSRDPSQELYDYPDNPDGIMERAKQSINRYRKGVKDLLAEVEPSAATFENLMVPLDHLENDQRSDQWCLFFLSVVHPDEKVREAPRNAVTMIHTNIRRPNVSKHANAIIAKCENLDAEAQRFLEDEARPIKYFGDDTKGIWLSEAELEGLPKETIDSFDPGEQGFFVKENSSAYLKLLKYCVKPDTRERIWMEMQKDDCNGNVALYKETVALRDERARIHGFASHAAFQLRNNMITDPEAVRKLLTKFQKRVARIGVIDHIKETKRNDPAADDKTLQFWDKKYYERIWMENAHSFDATKISEYFPLQSTVREIFDLYGALFGIVVEKMDVKLWHDDAEIYSIWDEESSGGGFSGYIYLDLVRRSGKSEEGCIFNQQPGYVSRNNERKYAVCGVVCNFSPPTASQPCLLYHKDVLSLFHKISHGMHDVLSRNTYGRYTGSYRSCDFDEALSLLLEHWCWIPEVLKKFSTHYDTGEKIPDDLIQGIIGSRQVVDQIFRAHEVAFAMFDLTVFTPASKKAAQDMDLAEIFYELNSQFDDVKGPEDYRHSHGYARIEEGICDNPGSVSLYFSGFCFAELIWKSFFEKNPMSKEAGMRWRREVLEKGSTMKPLDILEGLLGKRPDVEDLCN